MNQQDLFSVPKEASPVQSPLANRMAPATIDEFEGQESILGPGKLLRRAIEADRISSLILFGPPGTGKTACARIIASRTKSQVEETNAVVIGISDIRRIIDEARRQQQVSGRKTILLLDEIHHFNRSQQDALLPSVEKGIITLIGITTENPYFYINPALLSRSLLFEFNQLTTTALESIFDRAVTDPLRGVGGQRITVEPAARSHIIAQSSGDARRMLNALEIGVLTTPPDQNGRRHITLQVAEESLQKRAMLYDRSGDEHYDHVSAFIKSMRGSDPDAALYWMAKMLAAGEDPRFIARRIIICASEDVGNADPQALVLAAAALTAIEFVGMPEAKIPLAQAVTYVASAPKSNASYLALAAAEQEVMAPFLRPVPNHLKDSHADGAGKRGHGSGYLYPHDYPGHFVVQEYWRNAKTLYEPSDQGYEAALGKRLSAWRQQSGNTKKVQGNKKQD